MRADEIGGGVDGGQGVARVFAVDRQKAAPAQAAVIMVFMAFFVVLVITAASFASKVMGTF